MKARRINFDGRTKTKSYGLNLDGPNKIGLDFDNTNVYISLNGHHACICDYDIFLDKISDYIYNSINNDIYEFSLSSGEFGLNFKDVWKFLKWE